MDRTNMHKASFSTWLKTGAALRRFRAGDKGSVAPIVALSAIPLVFIAGIAIDSSRQSTAQVEVQAATDAAALAAAAAYATGNNEYEQVAKSYFDKSVAQTPYLANLSLAKAVSVDTTNPGVPQFGSMTRTTARRMRRGDC